MTIKDKQYPSPPRVPATTKKTLQEMEAMMESVRAQVESVRAQMQSIEEVQAELELMIGTEKNLNLQQEKKVQQSEVSMEAIAFAERMSINIIGDPTDDGEGQVTDNANGRRCTRKDNDNKHNGEDCNSDAEAGPVTNNNHSDENDVAGQTAENDNDSATSSTITTALDLSDEDVKQMLFAGSTHRLLFLDTILDPSGRGLDYKVSCWDRFLAIGVIVFQCLAYVILALAVMGQSLENGASSDWRPLEIQTKYCQDPNYPYNDPNFLGYYNTLSEAVDLNSSNLLASLKCEEPLEADPVFGDSDGWAVYLIIPLAVCMLWAFLLPDLFEGFVLFKCRGWAGKIISMLVYLELFLAICAGWTGLLGYYTGAFGFLDTILFIVGIVFVHDLDEKFEHWRGILRQVKQRYRCLECQFWTLSLVTYFILFYGSLYSSFSLYGWFEDRV